MTIYYLPSLKGRDQEGIDKLSSSPVYEAGYDKLFSRPLFPDEINRKGLSIDKFKKCETFLYYKQVGLTFD